MQWPTAIAPSAMRSVWKFFITERKPWCSAPSRLPAGMRQSSNTSSAVSEERQPVLSSARPTLKPGVPFSTMNIEIACRVSPVRAATKHQVAVHAVGDEQLAAVEHPVVAVAVVDRTARVRMPATSDPAPGSVIATAVISSPAMMRGR